MYVTTSIRLRVLDLRERRREEKRRKGLRFRRFLLDLYQILTRQRAAGANVNTTDESNSNRTVWPLDGGSLVIDFHHPWTYVSFNLGLGSNTSTFNIPLNPMLLNETGNGTICIPKWTLPADLGIADGDEASLQVITIGDSGTALYNVRLCLPASNDRVNGTRTTSTMTVTDLLQTVCRHQIQRKCDPAVRRSVSKLQQCRYIPACPAAGERVGGRWSDYGYGHCRRGGGHQHFHQWCCEYQSDGGIRECCCSGLGHVGRVDVGICDTSIMVLGRSERNALLWTIRDNAIPL